MNAPARPPLTLRIRWKRPLPKVPSRLHYDSGYKHTSWTAELRAIVDGEQFVIRQWSARKGWRYRVVWRYDWERMWIQPGPLPRVRKPVPA